MTAINCPFTMWMNVPPRAMTVYWFQSFILTRPPSACRSPILPISRLLARPAPSTTWPRHARMRMGVFSE